VEILGASNHWVVDPHTHIRYEPSLVCIFLIVCPLIIAVIVTIIVVMLVVIMEAFFVASVVVTAPVAAVVVAVLVLLVCSGLVLVGCLPVECGLWFTAEDIKP